jgi:hypothetical protein
VEFLVLKRGRAIGAKVPRHGREASSGGAERQEGLSGGLFFPSRAGRRKALKAGDPVVFYSSEEKRAWKQRQEGKRLREEYGFPPRKDPEGETPRASEA